MRLQFRDEIVVKGERMFRDCLKESVTRVTCEVWSSRGCPTNSNLQAASRFKAKRGAVNTPSNSLFALKDLSTAYAKTLTEYTEVSVKPHKRVSHDDPGRNVVEELRR